MFFEFKKPDGTAFTINSQAILYAAPFDAKTTYLHMRDHKDVITVAERYATVSAKLRNRSEAADQ